MLPELESTGQTVGTGVDSTRYVENESLRQWCLMCHKNNFYFSVNVNSVSNTEGASVCSNSPRERCVRLIIMNI